MRIEFKNVLPIPLADSPLSVDSCWKKESVIDSGATYLVEAPSGTGKTTLINIIYGTRHDYEGNVLMDGKDIADFSIDHWTMLRQGFLSAVFQDLRLFPQLTALENIQIKNNLKSTLKEEEIFSMAELLGVAHRMKQKCGTLSLGQQQRIAIIRALAQPFRLILLDEPFSHLDEENSRKACRMIEESCIKNQAGILLTSLGPTDYFKFTGKIII
ncbi:ATP-binding cassette domain-containing protein [soil metagenome]